MVIGSYISITTINVLNAPTKRHRLVGWIQKQDPYISCLQEIYLRPMDTYRLKVREWERVFHANGNHKKPGVAILILGKIDFKTKTVIRDKEGHYAMIKDSVQKRHNKYICIQHRSTATFKANTNKHKGRNRQ